jgi:tetratricopeptide (TPR) repeat protein
MEELNAELEKARTQLKVSAEVIELLTLARAFRSWKEWDHALEYYDAAIALEPNNPDTYIQKSFVYAGEAEQIAEQGGDPIPLYEQAIKLTEKSMEVDKDKSFGRAYYDRACYKNKLKRRQPKMFWPILKCRLI